jgi:hypothetical protein
MLAHLMFLDASQYLQCQFQQITAMILICRLQISLLWLMKYPAKFLEPNLALKKLSVLRGRKAQCQFMGINQEPKESKISKLRKKGKVFGISLILVRLKVNLETPSLLLYLAP